MAGRHARPDGPASVTGPEELAAWIGRLIDLLEDRAAADPVGGIHFKRLARRLEDARKVSMFRANRGAHHYSLNEIARVYGTTKQNISAMAIAGEKIYAERHGGTVARIGIKIFRRDRYEATHAAGVDDRTATPQQRAHLRAVGE